MANEFYSDSGNPGTGAAGSSSVMRAEFAAIEAGFDKLPTMAGNANKAVVVNSGGTALTLTAGALALAAAFTLSGAFATTLTVTGVTNVTLPTTGTLATLAGVEELDNKTLDSSVGKGTWTASGTWTLPAFTLGGTVSGGGNQINNVIIGAVSPLAGSFTTLNTSGNATLGDAVGDAHAVNGQLTITDDTITALGIQRSGGDQVFIGADVAGGGGLINARNSIAADYEPFAITAEYFAVNARTGVLTAAEIARVTSTGLGVFTTPSYELDVSRSSAGASVVSRVRNSDNTNAASHAMLYLQNGGASSGDAKIVFENAGLNSWAIGSDNSDSDKYKICFFSDLGTNDYLTIDTSGSVAIPTAGPHAIGTATNANVAVKFGGTFAGSTSNAQGANIEYTLTPAANLDAYMFAVSGTINEAGAGTHPDFVGALFIAPTIGAGAAALTNASTVKIISAPSGATNNYALWVDAGRVRIDEDLIIQVLATASLPAAAAAQDGRIIIEDAGAGDRNLIIYAAGQRFRIDGGAAF